MSGVTCAPKKLPSVNVGRAGCRAIKDCRVPGGFPASCGASAAPTKPLHRGPDG